VSRDAVAAGAIAALVGGAPSTAWALVSGADPLEPTLAAGSLLVPNERRRARLVLAAVPVHLVLSLGWAFVLERVLPRRHGIAAGTVAGATIAALDLGLVGRSYKRIRELPLAPQVADHLAYGATVGYVLSRRRR
jgi:hypothetical protein